MNKVGWLKTLTLSLILSLPLLSCSANEEAESAKDQGQATVTDASTTLNPEQSAPATTVGKSSMTAAAGQPSPERTLADFETLVQQTTGLPVALFERVVRGELPWDAAMFTERTTG